VQANVAALALLGVLFGLIGNVEARHLSMRRMAMAFLGAWASLSFLK
jgi:hypothetical protein